MYKRNMHYRKKSLKEVINIYAQEAIRLNEEDRKITQRFIVNEVYARIKETFDMLDDNPEEVEKIYEQFLQP